MQRELDIASRDSDTGQSTSCKYSIRDASSFARARLPSAGKIKLTRRDATKCHVSKASRYAAHCVRIWLRTNRFRPIEGEHPLNIDIGFRYRVRISVQC